MSEPSGRQVVAPANQRPINQLFLKNMAALWRTDPRLAQRIDDLPEGAAVELVPSKSGPMTARMKTPDGRAIFLHSRYDPLKEAETFADAADVEDKNCLLVSGLGLGYHVNALFERMHGEAAMVIAEPSLELIKSALENVDLAEALGSARVFFLCDLDQNQIHTRLNSLGARTMLGTHFVVHQPSQQVAGEFQQAMRSELTDYLAYSKMSLQTLVHNARITNTNVANNLVTYVTTPPIELVKNRFEGYPAIVVAAGPSLVNNIGVLADAQGRAVIIAVQTTFKTLLAQGIVPDFVTSLDYAEISRRFFEGVEDFRGVHLVAEPKATCGVIDIYDGPISLLDNEFARLCLGEELGRRDGLKAGATVAHLAFYLAEYLGCDPVAFVGQDLAFTNGVFYTPGVEVHNSWRPEMSRFYSIETKEWERVMRHRDHLRKIRDVHGREVYTDEQLFTYLQQFESDFAGSAVTVVDATEGGAVKAHTTPMRLAEFVGRYCREPIDPARLAYRRRVTWRDPSRLKPAREALLERCKEVAALRELCERMREVLDELKGLVDKPASFNRRIVRVDELRAAVQRQDRIYGMVTMVAQMAEFRRFAADQKLSSDKSAGAKRALGQLERDIEFVDALIEGAEELSEILRGAVQRFDRALAREA
jgi:hypothetical protein